MRVISGSARGSKLVSPEGMNTRPTLDRVKEALFNMLAPYISAAAALDAFAGSGALGIEALSRGAESAVFVDSAAAAETAVRRNLEKTRLAGRASIVRGDTLGYLNSCGKIFSLILLDPPYGGGLYEAVLKLIAEKNLLSAGGVIAAEWDEDIHVPDFPPCFERFRDKKYGRVHITLLRKPTELKQERS